MIDNFEKTAEQAASFQKLWMESASRMMQAALQASPNSDPEVLNQIRSSIFRALAQSWEEFMRSPQFLESMKQWMENAVTFRKMSAEFLAKVRNEFQAPSRDDVDTVMLAIRHLETRLLDRIDGISSDIAALKSNTGSSHNPRPVRSSSRNVRKPRTSRRTAANQTKEAL